MIPSSKFTVMFVLVGRNKIVFHHLLSILGGFMHLSLFNLILSHVQALVFHGADHWFGVLGNVNLLDLVGEIYQSNHSIQSLLVDSQQGEAFQ